MTNRNWSPDGIAGPFGAYNHCCEIPGDSRLLTIAGQVGVKPDGETATGFDAQCEWCFNNLLAVLSANDMGPEDLVKLGIYLTDREQIAPYRAIRERVLGNHIVPPGTLVIVSGLAQPAWLLEIEGYAAR